MTDHPLCPLCPPDKARPMYDGAYVGPECANDLSRALERVVLVAGEATTTVAKLSRSGGGGRRTSPEQPLPLNLGAGMRHDAAVNELVTRVRMVSEERGVEMPNVRTGRCGHATCAQRRAGLVYGPRCVDRPAEHPIAAAALWLCGQLDWLRRHPDAEVAMRDLRSACWALERVVDRRPDEVVVGRCPCETWLYARQGAASVRCRDCGTEYDVATSRAALMDDLAERLVTGAELATLAVYMGHRASREATRNLIKVWGNRGLIEAHGLVDGAPAYRCGEVMTRLMAAAG